MSLKKYRHNALCIFSQLLRDGEILIHNLDEVKELLSNYVKEFHETSPDIFDDIINCNDLNVKNDDASILLREKGNSLYQAKQFKVKK